MKICIVGAGAIGCLIGAKLAAIRRAQVSVVARGQTLQALQRDGWRASGETFPAIAMPARATQNPVELGEQDVIVLAVKGHSVLELAPSLVPLIGPSTLIVAAQNGVPWWFTPTLPAPAGPMPLQTVDPRGIILQTLPIQQVVGCVMHTTARTLAPGVVRHTTGWELILGEPASSSSARIQPFISLLGAASFKPQVSPSIHRDVWYKLWGNLTMNPVSALTRATTDEILSDPLVRQFCSAAMLEAAEIGRRIGCPLDQTPEDRHEVTLKHGAFKTSMLQDLEAGRLLEIDPIVSAVQELGARVGVATPHIDILLGLTRLMAKTAALRQAAAHKGTS